MLCRAEAEGQDLCQGPSLVTLLVHHVDHKIILAELPHDLAADAAGRECAGDDAILAAADGDGHEIPVAVINSLEKSCAFAAVGGTVGGVFDVAALVHGAVSAEQRGTDLEAGVGCVGVGHGLLGQFHEFFWCHRSSYASHSPLSHRLQR